MIRINLIVLRQKNKLTQGAFANTIGIKREAYQAYEEGRCNPPLKVIKKIVDLYNVNDTYKFLFEYYE
jgi:DNA-binding XRE family transcriptional regulator